MAPTLVFIQADPSCASAQNTQLFVEELRVRLPEQVSIRQSAPTPTTQAWWALAWSPSKAQGACQLTLSDTEPVVELPLDQRAEPAQIREVAVRLAWFISTTPARAPQPEQPKTLPSAQALLEQGEPTPTTTPDPNPAPKPQPEPTPEPAPEIATPEATQEPEEPQPGEPKKAVATQKVASTLAPENFVQEVALRLKLWQNQNPNIFGSLDQKLTPMPETVFGDPSTLGLYAGLSTDVTIIQEQPAWVGNVHLGTYLTNRIGLGVSYRNLLSDIRFIHEDDAPLFNDPNNPDEFTSPIRQLSLHMMSLDAEYLLFPEENIHIGLGGALGAGWATSKGVNFKQKDSVAVLSTMLNVNIYYDIMPWVQAGFGLSWRDVYGKNLGAVGDKQFSGPSGTFTLRVGLF